MSDEAWNPNPASNYVQEKPATLGTWLELNNYIDDRTYAAVVWPKDFETVRSLSIDAGINQITVLDESDNSGVFERLRGVNELNYLTHDFVENGSSNYDLEYGWAISTDIANQINEGNTLEEAMGAIVETSEELLSSQGTAIYNTEYLEVDPRINDSYEKEERVSIFEEVIEDTAEAYVEVVEPDYLNSGSGKYLIWTKK